MWPRLLEFFKNFGNLIDTALIVSLGGLLSKILNSTIKSKDAHIKLLEGQLKASQMFAPKNVNDQFKALQEWYDRSVQTLEQEKQKAIESRESELKSRIEEEIKKRRELIDEYSRQSSLVLEDPPPGAMRGRYRVVGQNHYSSEISYFGELTIRQEGEVLHATWLIADGQQEFSGIGLALGNAIALGFKEEKGPTSATGVVLYRFIGPDVMRGVWTGFGAENLGTEECRKMETNCPDFQPAGGTADQPN